MSTVATVLTKIGYKIFDDPALQTITTTSEPTSAECIEWLNEGIDVLVQLFSEWDSPFGKSVGQITLQKSLKITDITQASPGVITTSEAHGLVDGESYYITGVDGMVEVNNTTFKADVLTTTTVELLTSALVDVDTSSYTEYTGSGVLIPHRYYTDLATALLIPSEYAVIFDGSQQYPMTRVRDRRSIDHPPNLLSIPREFYLDSSGNFYPLPFPDETYLVEIPYWAIPTALTATTDTMPYGGRFDRYLIQAVVNIFLNKKEYAAQFEEFWRQYWTKQLRDFSKKRGGVPTEFEME